MMRGLTIPFRSVVLHFSPIVLVTSQLYGQLQQSSTDVISFKTMPVHFDKDYGANIARIGDGRLVQMEVTIVEIPPGGRLPARKLLAEEVIYIISGKGTTTMWTAEQSPKKINYDWSAGDV